MAWSSIRADRVLQLALIGQILVWTIATLVPPPIMAYGLKTLGLLEKLLASCRWPRWGSASAVGCLLAGKLSGAKVEYGLLPLGALGLTVSTLAFAVIGPGLPGRLS